MLGLGDTLMTVSAASMQQLPLASSRITTGPGRGLLQASTAATAVHITTCCSSVMIAWARAAWNAFAIIRAVTLARLFVCIRCQAGTVSAVVTPMIASTTMTSVRVKPLMARCFTVAASKKTRLR